MAKSSGHIAWSLDRSAEFYEVQGEVFRAPIGNAFDVDTNARNGRWECSRSMWDRYFAAVYRGVVATE